MRGSSYSNFTTKNSGVLENRLFRRGVVKGGLTLLNVCQEVCAITFCCFLTLYFGDQLKILQFSHPFVI